VGAKYPAVSNKYALALLEVKKPADALSVLQESLKLYPQHPLTSLNLARVLMDLGRAREAEPPLISAVSVNPFDPEVHARLYEVARAKNDQPLAQRAAKAIAALDGVDAELGFVSLTADALARVYVNGMDTGLTTPVKQLALPAGKHVLRFERVDGAGYKDVDVTVEAGRTLDVRAELTRS
jgi:tetratricopeptide (TPR) repeat protein